MQIKQKFSEQQLMNKQKVVSFRYYNRTTISHLKCGYYLTLQGLINTKHTLEPLASYNLVRQMDLVEEFPHQKEHQKGQLYNPCIAWDRRTVPYIHQLPLAFHHQSSMGCSRMEPKASQQSFQLQNLDEASIACQKLQVGSRSTKTS